MQTDRTLSRTFSVGRRYRCTLTVPVQPGIATATGEWEPDVPVSLTDAELADYRAGRALLMRELAQVLGANVLVVDAP